MSVSPADPKPLAAEGESPRHVVAVIGGATAGAEIAFRLAELGARVVVFEQNPRPYGKIEDGLPRWHVGLRRKEFQSIVSKLDHPRIDYVPCTRVGRDVPMEAIGRQWGFSAVVLACGAWRDRPLPIEGADAYVGRGLIYQNPFIIWFNHAEEKGWEGERFEVHDGALVVGGGLASIDVVKVLMLESTRAALAERGIQVPMLELEVKGIPKVLASHGLRFEDLGLEGCTLVYRRRVEDMPLVDAPEGADEARLAKVRKARARLLGKAMEKYRFRVEPLAAPEALRVEEGRVVGLELRRTRIEDGRVVPTDERFELRGSYVISSIGSIPEPLPGLAMKGELFAFNDWDLGRIEAWPSLFSVGNVVTGKGNIVASRKHAAHVSETALERFLGLGEAGHEGEEALLEASSAERREAARAALPEPGAEARILAHVHARQREVGYEGDLRAWLARVTPPELEAG